MQPDISVIIPVYNEKATVLEIIGRLMSAVKLQNKVLHIIVVDDGSTDGTDTCLIASHWYQDPRFLFLRHKENKGKGAAIRTAIPHLQGKYSIVQDADLEYDPNDIGEMYDTAVREQLPVLFGSRNVSKKNTRGSPLFYWGGKTVTWAANILYGLRLTDEATCYKLIETKVLQSFPLVCERFEFCPELTAYVAKAGIPIKEVAVHYSPRKKQEGKKIGWRDGAEALWTLFRLRFVVSSPIIIAALLTIFSIFLYLLTWQGTFGGYERETADAASALFDGDYAVKRAGIGAVILYTPFILFERLFSLERFHEYLNLVPLVYSAVTIGILFLAVQLVYKKMHVALGVSMLVALGSIVWPYTNMGMEYQAMLYITLLLYCLLLWREGRVHVFVPSVVLGLLILAKSYGVLIGAAYVVFIIATLWEQKRLLLLKRVVFLTSVLVLPALALVSVFGLNFLVHGTVSGAYSLSHEFQIWTWWEGIYGSLFSIGKSIFLYSPLLIVALLYWRKFTIRDRAVSLFVLIAFGVLFLITAPFSYWSDETWGVRKLVPIIPLLHLPLGIYLLSSATRIKRVLFAALVICAFYVQVLGAVYPYDRQLRLLREVNMDSLQTMRYVPQFSHVVLYHQFMKSLVRQEVFEKDTELAYVEPTWFRWLEHGKDDVELRNVRVSLVKYHTPAAVWFRAGPFQEKNALLLFVFAGMVISFGILVGNYKYHCHKDRNIV